jgi:hypothetical protein
MAKTTPTLTAQERVILFAPHRREPCRCWHQVSRLHKG